jgi:hypothetical protein
MLQIIFVVIRRTSYSHSLPRRVDKLPGADILDCKRTVPPKHICGVQCALGAERVMRSQSLGVYKQAYVLVSIFCSSRVGQLQGSIERIDYIRI